LRRIANAGCEDAHNSAATGAPRRHPRVFLQAEFVTLRDLSGCTHDGFSMGRGLTIHISGVARGNVGDKFERAKRTIAVEFLRRVPVSAKRSCDES
jgi:hypothetical protein